MELNRSELGGGGACNAHIIQQARGLLLLHYTCGAAHVDAG